MQMTSALADNLEEHEMPQDNETASTHGEPSTALDEGKGSTKSDELLRALFDRVGANASAEAVFGSPIEHAGQTVVPVASIRWGGGVGGSRRDGPRNGGAGIVASPMGYITMSNGKVAFHRITNPMTLASAAAVAVLGLAVLIPATATLLKRGA